MGAGRRSLGEAACGCSIFPSTPWGLDLFSFYGVISFTADSLHDFELFESALSFDFFWFGRKCHCGNMTNSIRINNLYNLLAGSPYGKVIVLAFDIFLLLFSEKEHRMIIANKKKGTLIEFYYCITPVDIIKKKGTYFMSNKCHVGGLQTPGGLPVRQAGIRSLTTEISNSSYH